MIAGTSTLPNGVTVGYGFDNDSRITGLSYSAGSTQLGNLTYGYDADGRVTSKNGTLAAIALPTAVSGNTFNADNGMTGFGGTTLSYDANGNLANDGTNTYTWDARNHLTAISGAATASFTYDAFGRRASKSIGTTTTQFLYDRLNPVQELQAGAPSANLLTGRRLDENFARADSSNSLCVANSNSGGSRGLKEAVAVSAPVIRIEACGRRRKCTAPLSRREPGQSGVTANPVVICLVGFQLELEIALAPKQCPVENLSPYCPDQSLHESMRAGRAGNGLDLVDLEYPKVRQPAMKAEQGIVVG